MGGSEVYCYICGGPTTNYGEIIDPKHMNKIYALLDDLVNKQTPQKRKRLEKNVTRGHNIYPENIVYYLEEEFTKEQKDSDMANKVINLINKNIINIRDKKQYKWLENLILLRTSGTNINVTNYDSWGGKYNSSDGTIYESRNWPKHVHQYDGIVMHSECYKLKSKRYGKFTIDDLDFSKQIKYGKIKEHQTQDVMWDNIFCKGDEWMLESPATNAKNLKRIGEIEAHILVHDKSRAGMIEKIKSKYTQRMATITLNRKTGVKKKVKRNKKLKKKSKSKIVKKKVKSKIVKKKTKSKTKTKTKTKKKTKSKTKKTKTKTKTKTKKKVKSKIVKKKVKSKIAKKKIKSKISRPSPPYSAKDFPNKRKKGGNGKMWKSTTNKNGVYRWQKI